MKAKEVYLTDKETGEQTTGTMQEIADKIEVSKKTLSRWITSGHFENEHWDIGTYLTSNIGTLGHENKEKTIIGTSIPKSLGHRDKGNDDPDINRPILQPDGKLFIKKAPCIKCGQPVYHTLRIDGKIQHICFGSCTPIEPKVIKQPNQATLEYIRAFNKANSPKTQENDPKN
jgi:hypothetical protein